ncbi:putative oxygenase [Methylotuvimicrobium alcaliphilum 20Z]|uniref:Oxygenase n=1 Tax=Methylotuvimicrobium alcaliphilum (strain DSM 19304 / NCIMB 14124 / VKM B-2133 / 20Z) TaxID=1091494 RepID=G4STP9_META2|nr:putative oxygenase [Methylotuvimicrobium alcaliphilum 20Z]
MEIKLPTINELCQKIRPGKIAPDFLLPEIDGMPVTFYEHYCGQGPVVIVFSAIQVELLRYAPIADHTNLLGVFSRKQNHQIDSPFPILQDDGRLTQAFLNASQVSEPLVLILRPTLTVFACLENPTLNEIDHILDAVPSHNSIVCNETAPVLIVPEVLPSSLCTQLIAAHEADNFDSGMVRMVAGEPTLIPDAKTKIRRDHRLSDPDLAQAVNDALVERLLPVIARAFHYSVSRLEGYKVVAYDAATGGYFRLHRDNVTPDAQHRRFALSLNLNDDYSGGEIVFPEFGAKRYRPPAGGALVFSGTLLHAATDVTAGKRYVLLTFMWGDDVSG